MEHNGSGSLVRADMSEQPAVIEGLIGRRGEVSEALARLKARPPDGVLLVARGSSDNAAVYGRYALEASTRKPVALAANSLWTRYNRAALLPNWLVIAISQSGATPEIADVTRRSRESGSFTLAITNDPHSELAASADATLALGAELERAVPATKTYTATLVALALVAEALGDPLWKRQSLEGLPEMVATILDRLDGLEQAANLLAQAQPGVHLGRGFLYGTALETALKLREMAGVVADGFAIGDFLHGPIVTTVEGTPAVCHVGGGPTREDAYLVAAAVRARGGRVVTITSGDPSSEHTVCLSVPRVDETLAAVVHAIAAQRIALEVAVILGLDPDYPLGLKKVTTT